MVLPTAKAAVSSCSAPTLLARRMGNSDSTPQSLEQCCVHGVNFHKCWLLLAMQADSIVFSHHVPEHC